mgnify:CR=1 FL=1
MKRLPIGELLLAKPRPATTLSLEPSVREYAAEMVESYVFTETIRHYMVRILDSVARGVGQGFWVQAEYGAGKTHFLAVLAALLSDTSEELWSRIRDDEVRQYRKRLENRRLFPVVLSLRGESKADSLTERSLLDVVIEQGLRPALARAGLASVLLTAADDILHWLETSPSDALRADVESFVARETGTSLAAYRAAEGTEAAARLIIAYCERNAISPAVAAGLKSRLLQIYRQITTAANGRYIWNRVCYRRVRGLGAKPHAPPGPQPGRRVPRDARLPPPEGSRTPVAYCGGVAECDAGQARGRPGG